MAKRQSTTKKAPTSRTVKPKEPKVTEEAPVEEPYDDVLEQAEAEAAEDQEQVEVELEPEPKPKPEPVKAGPRTVKEGIVTIELLEGRDHLILEVIPVACGCGQYKKRQVGTTGPSWCPRCELG